MILAEDLKWLIGRRHSLVNEIVNTLLAGYQFCALPDRRIPRDAPDFVEVGEAGIAVDDAMRHRRCLQLVCRRTWFDGLQAQL